MISKAVQTQQWTLKTGDKRENHSKRQFMEEQAQDITTNIKPSKSSGWKRKLKTKHFSWDSCLVTKIKEALPAPTRVSLQKCIIDNADWCQFRSFGPIARQNPNPSSPLNSLKILIHSPCGRKYGLKWAHMFWLCFCDFRHTIDMILMLFKTCYVYLRRVCLFMTAPLHIEYFRALIRHQIFSAKLGASLPWTSFWCSFPS